MGWPGPNYALTDAGLVVTDGGTGALFSTIDPGPVVDPAGNLWTTWGSGFGHDFSKTQLWLTRLDPTTGLPLTSDATYRPPTSPGHGLQTGRKEGSYLYERQGSYYLFYNTGGCCAGTASTYTIWVARATSITGPFTGDRIFFASHDDIHGPGHMGIYDDCGASRFTYHYYPTASSILGENDLSWGADGWPVAGAESTTPLKPCGSNQGGGAAATGTGGGAGAGGRGAGQGGRAGSGSPGGAAGNHAASGGSGGNSTAGGGPGPGGAAGASARGAGGGTNDPNGAAGSSGDRGGQTGGGNVAESGTGCSCTLAETSRSTTTRPSTPGSSKASFRRAWTTFARLPRRWLNGPGSTDALAGRFRGNAPCSLSRSRSRKA